MMPRRPAWAEQRQFPPLLVRDDRLIIVKAATEAIWQGLAPPDARWMADSFPGSITERIPDAEEGTSRR